MFFIFKLCTVFTNTNIMMVMTYREIIKTGLKWLKPIDISWIVLTQNSLLDSQEPLIENVNVNP